MKKTLITLILLAGSAGWAAAQAVPEPVFQLARLGQAAAAVETFTVKGLVLSVTPVAKSSDLQLTVKDASGQETALTVKPATTLYDAKWQPAAKDILKPGISVKVKYRTASDGTAEALAVTVVR